MADCSSEMEVNAGSIQLEEEILECFEVDIEEGDDDDEEYLEGFEAGYFESIKYLLFPFLYFDLLKSEGWRVYLEFILHGPLDTTVDGVLMVFAAWITFAHDWTGTSVEDIIQVLNYLVPTFFAALCLYHHFARSAEKKGKEQPAIASKVVL